MGLRESLYRWQDRAVWGKYIDDVRMSDPDLQSWWDGLHASQRRAIALRADRLQRRRRDLADRARRWPDAAPSGSVPAGRAVSFSNGRRSKRTMQ
jgi:hypothetical protein